MTDTQTAADPITDAIEQAITDYEAGSAPEGGADGGGDEQPDLDAVDDEVELEDEPDGDVEDGDEGGGDDEADDDDDEDEPDSNSEAVELEDDAKVRLSDGSEATVRELREGSLRQQDYTKKTQELASRRKQVEDLYGRMEQWYEQRAGDPAGWIREIAEGADDPDTVMVDAIGGASDPNLSLAKVIRGLAESGKLAKEFVDRFQLQEVVQSAPAAAGGDDRVAKLERKLEERDEQAQRDQRTQQLLAEYEHQWKTIVADEGLTYDDSEQEGSARAELLRFARDNEIPNLQTAWAAMQYQRGGKAATSEDADVSKAKAKDAVQRKRKTKAMGRTRSAPAPKPPREGGDVNAAIDEAMAELGFAE